MDPLLRASLTVRRLIRRGHGTVLVFGLAAFVAAGLTRAPFGPEVILAVLLWLFLLITRTAVRAARDVEPREPPVLVDFEIGALLSVGLVAALLRHDGSLSGRLGPATYVLVAFVAAFARPLASVLAISFLLALELVVRARLLRETRVDDFALHVGFAVAFAVVNHSFLRAEAARLRARARARVDQALLSLKEDARSYRLLGAGEAARQDARSEDRLARSSVEEIHESVHYALELLRRALGLHTAVLLWLNDAGTHLRISELASSSDELSDTPFLAGDGVLGAVVARREPVVLGGLKPSYKIPYYAGPCPVRVLGAYPVLDGQTLCGVLAIDREDDLPFSAEEAETAELAARFCLRAIQSERVFVHLERAKVEQGKLYRAAQALGAATSEKAVVEEAVRAAREIASFDFAAVTVFNEATQVHEVCAAQAADATFGDLVGARFASNGGLVSMVVQNRCPLPYRGEFDPAHQYVLTKRYPWPRVPSLLVLPLLLGDRPLGTLILGARRKHAFGDAVRPTLEVLASHVAVSLSNARLIHKLETMATTDGLTGLLNKRAMLEQAEQRIAAATRFGRKLAVLIADIDWFKKVNDTFGHDVGDIVIRGLAEILRKQKRASDVVARFGGEEFVVVCEQTDEAGAVLLAERIREEFARTVFHGPKGALRVTCSVGVATFPDAGRDWESLFRAADEALYASKRGGRNRTTAHVSSSPPASLSMATKARRQAG